MTRLSKTHELKAQHIGYSRWAVFIHPKGKEIRANADSVFLVPVRGNPSVCRNTFINWMAAEFKNFSTSDSVGLTEQEIAWVREVVLEVSEDAVLLREGAYETKPSD